MSMMYVLLSECNNCISNAEVNQIIRRPAKRRQSSLSSMNLVSLMASSLAMEIFLCLADVRYSDRT